MVRALRVCFLVLVPLALAAAPGLATSYVPMTDAALVDQAPVIAVVQVRGSAPAPGAGRPFTDHSVQVERVLKGALSPGREIAVRVPGGVRPDGLALRIWGAPRFRKGERALLFLFPRTDGSYAIAHLMLGAFHEVRTGGHCLALRNLSEAQAVARPGEALPKEPLRDFDRFVRWVAARAQGVRATADYHVTAEPELGQITEEFTLFEDGGDLYNMRWFNFDSGGSVEWRAYQTGQDGVTGGGFAEFQTAIAAWNDDPETTILYSYGGTTASTNGLEFYDSINSIVFNDPTNILPAFSCASGGVLAIGGPWYTTATSGFRGQQFHRIVNADIVTNDGLSCYFQSSPNGSKAAAELFGHELGHTLGLGHSCGDDDGLDPYCDNPLYNDALMRSYVHDDTRGARLNNDDRAGIAALYTPLPPPSSFFTLTPCRLLDTRDPNGPYGGPWLMSGYSRTFVAGGRCGIARTAKAIAVNVTVINALNPGHLTLYPADQALPSTSTINFNGPQARANNAIVVLSAVTKAFTVTPSFPFPLGAVHLVVDVNGYFE